MIPSNSLSVLMQIQPTIQRFARMLSSVLQLEVEIVDNTLCRVAGTGAYGKFLGRKLNTDSRLLRYIIETKKEKVVTHSRFDPLCKDCTNKENCKEKAFLGTPVIYQEQCVGVISLVALTREQQERINDNLHEFSDYVRHVSSIFVSRLLEDQGGGDNMLKMFSTMIENMDQGVLVVSQDQKVKFANQAAMKILGANHGSMIGKTIHFRPLTFAQNFIRGHVQHVISFDDKKELIIGQLHAIQDQWLFLMAFHQSHSSADLAPPQDGPQIEQMVGECRPMRQLKKLITRVAPSPSSVMIVGESGTGKEVVARAVHKLSDRQAKPFIAINCAAIPEQLLESELFGYVKGAFTGASANGKTGLIQAANHGTLFLDEIGDMPVALQVKLLRVLQERKVRPLGSNRDIDIDVRIISATHRDLPKAMARGEFREDLFYRLNVVNLKIPPLSERAEDIPLLANHLLRQSADRHKPFVRAFSTDAMKRLMAAKWPGNVRQLVNVIEQCVALTSSPVISDALVEQALEGENTALPTFVEARNQFELNYLRKLLQITKGNVTHAARMAGRNRTEFYKLLSRHELDANDFKE